MFTWHGVHVGSSGGNSVFGTVVAIGGTSGTNGHSAATCTTGGSGGGGSMDNTASAANPPCQGTPGQGYAGGTCVLCYTRIVLSPPHALTILFVQGT